MKKNSISIIAIACLASCLMVSCSKEETNAEQQSAKGTKIVIPAQKTATKAVGTDGVTTFKTTENVYIKKSGSSIDANVLHPTENAASTTFTGNLAGTYSEGDHIAVLYNTNASGVVDYSGQDGSIGGVKDAGWAEDVEIVSYDAGVLTTASANIKNLQSIFKFSFKNGSSEISNIRTVKISSTDNKLVSAYDVITPTSENTTHGPVTVSSASDLAVVYVALRFDANPSDAITFEVTDNAGKVYIGSKTAPEAGFTSGKFYTSTNSITVTPTSKLAFRGYEVSTGILERSKVGDADATYSLTSGAMIRDIATMTYSLPAGCNPFEPAVYYDQSTSLNKYFNKISVLKVELGADGDNINPTSDKLPAGWQFPSGGGTAQEAGTDWGNVLFAAPKSPITVNGTTVTAGNGLYAMAQVSLEAGNGYSVAAGTYYGMFLLRDGSNIPAGYFTELGLDSKYSDNVLTEAEFNALIQMGCLFISVTGYYWGDDGWRDLDDYYQYGYYWSNTYHDLSSNFYYFTFDEDGYVSVASHGGDDFFVVKLVKPL